MFEKFGQHQPLNRQVEGFAREGVEISLPTLADLVGIGVEAANGGAGDLDEAEQFGEHRGIGNIGSQRDSGDGHPVSRDSEMAFDARLAAVSWVRAAQITAVLGTDGATVDNDVRGLGGRLRSAADHPQEHAMDTRQNRPD